MSVTKEELQEWAINSEKKLDEQIYELAKKGVFKDLNENKSKLEAPIVMMFNGRHYNMNEKIIPLLAKMAESDQKGLGAHLFVTQNAVKQLNEEHPEYQGVKAGSKYMDLVLQVKRKEIDENEVVPSPTKVVPIGLVNGDNSTKLKFFLHHKNFETKKEYTMPIPYDDYGTRIAKLVDYSQITPEAIEKKGSAMEVIKEVWTKAKEEYRVKYEETQKEYDSRLENIKNAQVPTEKEKPTVKDEILYIYKKHYDKVMEEYKNNERLKDNIKEDVYPTRASLEVAKELLIGGIDLKTTAGMINNLDPNSSRNFKGNNFSAIVFRDLKSDYAFNKAYKEKFKKTFREAYYSAITNPKAQSVAR